MSLTPLTFKFGDAKEIACPQEPFPGILPWLDDDASDEDIDPELKDTCGDCKHWRPPFSGILFMKGMCSLNSARRPNLEWCKRYEEMKDE